MLQSAISQLLKPADEPKRKRRREGIRLQTINNEGSPLLKVLTPRPTHHYLKENEGEAGMRGKEWEERWGVI